MALSITKATVGGSEDTWGTITNTALDSIVSEINNNADGTNATTPNMTSLQIGGVAMTSSAAELNKLDGATVTTDELNILDGDTSATSTTVVDADRVVFNDAGTMKQVALSDIKTYINASVGSGSVTSVGLSVPTGLSVSGSPVTTSGTLAITFSSGYSLLTSAQATSISNIPTTTSQLTNDSGFITSQYSPPTTLGAVGTYAMLHDTTAAQLSAGSTRSGSALRYANALSDVNETGWAGYAPTGTVSAPSGTWRCMGTLGYAGENGTAATTNYAYIDGTQTSIWLRIS